MRRTPIPELAPSSPALPSPKAIALSATATLTTLATIGTLLSPYLVTAFPRVLLGLNPDARHVVLIASRVEPWQLVALGAFRRSLSFLTTFALAQVYTETMIRSFEARGGWARSLVAMRSRMRSPWGMAFVALVPFFWVALMAGFAGVPWRRFALAMVPGQIAYMMALQQFGLQVDDYTGPLLAFVAAHALELTGLATSIALLHWAWRRGAAHCSKVHGHHTADPDSILSL